MKVMPRIVGIFAIVGGVIMIIAGVATYALVTEQLEDEKIVVSDDADNFAGEPVDGPFTAYAEAEVIKDHALEASGGKTYAELDQDDPTRATVQSASFLRASLFTSVVAFGVAVLVVGLGILFILVGLAVLALDGKVKRLALAGPGPVTTGPNETTATAFAPPPPPQTTHRSDTRCGTGVDTRRPAEPAPARQPSRYPRRDRSRRSRPPRHVRRTASDGRQHAPRRGLENLPTECPPQARPFVLWCAGRSGPRKERHASVRCTDLRRGRRLVRPVHADQSAEYMAFGEAAGEVLRGGAALQPTSTATTVRVQGGKGGDVVTSDGPFAETKEVLGGFYLLECADLDEAIPGRPRSPVPGTARSRSDRSSRWVTADVSTAWPAEQIRLAETIRVEGGRVLASLTRTLGSLDLAEDAVQDAAVGGLGAMAAVGRPRRPARLADRGGPQLRPRPAASRSQACRQGGRDDGPLQRRARRPCPTRSCATTSSA